MPWQSFLLWSSILVSVLSYFWFKYDLRQKYHAPQVRPDQGSNSWPPGHTPTPTMKHQHYRACMFSCLDAMLLSTIVLYLWQYSACLLTYLPSYLLTYLLTYLLKLLLVSDRKTWQQRWCVSLCGTWWAHAGQGTPCNHAERRTSPSTAYRHQCVRQTHSGT